MTKSKSNQDFQSGETVRLISGGPIMTIKHVSVDEVECLWFAGKKLESGYFPNTSLIRVSVDEKEK